MTQTFRNAVMKQCICLIAASWLVCNVQLCAAEDIIELNVAEMSDKGSVLINIPQKLKWPSTQRKEYKVLTGQEYTEVTKHSGILKVRKQMDREVLCINNRPRCTMEIQVAALDQSRGVKMVNIRIEVTDINDNAPAFENTVIRKSISEAVGVGTTIRLDSAVDPDYGANSIQDYRLVSKGGSNLIDDYFELGTIINVDGSKIPKLTLTRKLDRENKGVHELILEAYDGGKPPSTGTAIVLINVTDSNDNIPKFEKDRFVVDVNEHEKEGTIVKQVHATDEDTGANGRIVYSFPSIVGERERKIFDLNRDTGVISVKNSTLLDYETKKIHHLTVEATDLGPNAVPAYTTVTVNIQDVNDNKPEFKVSFMQNAFVKKPPKGAEYDEIIMENTTPGEYIAFVTVSDNDAGANGTVTCELQDNGVFILEEIAGANSRFVLKTSDNLDRETKDSYTLKIKASDKGDPAQTSLKTLFLRVGDINDNAPEFSYDRLAVKVSETARQGTVVMTLKATDKDEKHGPNSNITYSFLPSSDHIVKDGRRILLTDIFQVKPSSGALILAIPDVLDAEVERTPGDLKVLAKDNGIPPLNTTTTLQITVIDENDNAPKFRNQSYVFRVDEHASEGIFVGQVEATDDDFSEDTNGKVTYSMEEFRPASGSLPPTADRELWLKMFQVGATSGYVHFYGNSTKLDREIYGDTPIVLTVVATDNGFNRQRAEAKVEIYLDDVNDNDPTVLRPDGQKDVGFVQIITNQSNRERSASPQAFKSRSPQKWISVVTVKEVENATDGGVGALMLSKVKAVDKDLGMNSLLSYAIVDGNQEGNFDVNAKNGNVTFAERVDLDAVKLGCRILKIRVSDFGTPKRHSDAYVNMYLSKSESTAVNATKAMQECKSNPLFPKLAVPSPPLKMGSTEMYLIIGAAALIVILIIVIVIVLIKCCCCAKRKKSRSYNCQEGGTWNTSSGGDIDSKRNVRKRGSSKRAYNGHGTVDSRSSFHSEWTQSQSQLPPDKADKVRVLPDLQSMGSAESPNAHDSGTGDSVSGEAYHHTQYNDMTDGQNFMPEHDGQYMQQPHRTMSPMKYSAQIVDLPPQHMHPYGDPYGRPVISPKCTEDCRLYGHGDHCWMPDSLLRNQGQGQIDVMAGGNPNRVVYQNHPDAHGLRYHGDPSTPYYYDPGKKFSHLSSTEGSDQMSYGKGLEEGYRHPLDAMSHQGYPVMLAPSPRPMQQRMYQNEMDRERAYINLQGYDQAPGQPDEMHSNLSSTSSNANAYGAGLPQNHPRAQGHPQQVFYQVPNPQGPRYETVYPGPPVRYDEDFSASNLLPAMTGTHPDYDRGWDRGVEQRPLIDRSEYMPSRSGRTSAPVLDDRMKSMPRQGDDDMDDGDGRQRLIQDQESLMAIHEGEAAMRQGMPL